MHHSTLFDPIQCLKNAWTLTTRAPVALWGAGLVLVMVDGCSTEFSTDGRDDFVNVQTSGPGFDMHWNNDEFLSNPFLVAGVMGVSILFLIAFGAVVAFLRAGYYKGVKSVMQGRDVQLGDMYSNSANWLPTFLVGIFKVLIGGLMFAVFLAFLFLGGIVAGGIGAAGLTLVVFIPMLIYVMLGLTFMKHAAAVDGFGPMQALSRSWELADGRRGELILMHLLQIGMAILGLLTCCLGLIPAAILMEIMWAEAYIQATDDGTLNMLGSSHGGQQPDDRSAEVVGEAPPQPRAGEPGAFDPGAWREDLDNPRQD